MENLKSKLDVLEARFNDLEDLMGQPEIALDHARVQLLAKERAGMEDVVLLYREYRELESERDDAKAIFEAETELALVALAREEVSTLDEFLGVVQHKIELALLPKDPNDDKNVIVEVRAGAGGREAALFATDLFRMYSRYGVQRGWNVDVLNTSPSELGGVKEIIFEVGGKGAFSFLKHERGVHRVQRVPATETMGRIHTSTATVAVLPVVDEVEVGIHPDELRIDIFHAGGHGGQNVNKVATAVRIVHLPTNTVAVCQDERSQFKNKQKAMAILRARLYEAEQQKQQSEVVQARRSQVGTGDRSEKVRTYNFPQDRITDHRISQTFHSVERVLDGGLNEITEALTQWEREQLMMASLK
jgi:peptide chain release factor 1